MSIAIDLSFNDNIVTQNLLEIFIRDYREEGTQLPQEFVLRFTDGNRAIVVGPNEFLPIGKLLTTQYGTSNIRTTDDRIQITISGVPKDSVKEIINSSIKGSFVDLSRVFFNTNNVPLPVRTDDGGNIVFRFVGYVETYNISEAFDPLSLEGTVVITLECLNIITPFKGVTQNLKTNPSQLRAITDPPDVSFDRIPNLIGASFNFGAPG